MGISVSFMSLKRTFFKIKRKPCLAGCKNEYKLSNHRLNTQIALHGDKFRVFFYWSRDHGRGMMTSYLGSLAYKSWKLTKIMPNSLKLLNHYILSNAPQKIRQWALKLVVKRSLSTCQPEASVSHFPFIFSNLSGFSTLLVTTCLLRLFTQDFYHGTTMIDNTKTISCTVRATYYARTGLFRRTNV